jgi:hypothetical protein
VRHRASGAPGGSFGAKIPGATSEKRLGPERAGIPAQFCASLDPYLTMARTSSNGAPAASMDALDNIDLDDMFADDGDALFDGLDIDLDMDDITGGGDLNSQPKASSTAALPPQGIRARAIAPREEAESSRTRRKTKRKAKTPAFFEDADDDFYDDAPVKKKKKATKGGAATRKKAPPKVTQDGTSTIKQQPPQPPTTKGKGKAKVAAMPPPLPMARGTSTPGSYVAAAGQFGGRQKRGASFTTTKSKLPMARSASESKLRSTSLPTASAAAASAAASAALSAAASSQVNDAQHQPGLPQSTYCGIQPSNTLFYPFMPSLPPEPSIKSRKVYSAIDRIHSSFTSHLHSQSTTAGIAPAKESEPIFQLMREAFKEEKPSASQHSIANRSESVGNAIGALRRTISLFDKNRMVGDWYAVCALLQRQHDFLKQNAENMERWCKDNFSEEDYASVYLPSSKKRRGTDGSTELSILGSFTIRELKVKILCNGFKEPKISGPLIATLPQLFSPEESTDKTTKPVAKSKKRKQHVTTTATDIKSPEVASHVKPKQPSQPLSYVNMKPARRRKNVAEMLSRTARELENSYLNGLDVCRRAIDRQESDLQKNIEQDHLGLHTAGMWKWLETSGYFSNVAEADIQQLLEDGRSQEIPITTAFIDNHSDQKRAALVLGEGASGDTADNSVFDRLQSLLIEEDTGEIDDVDEDDVVEEVEFEEIYTVRETADMSRLTLDERSYIHLCSFGLADSLTVPVACPVIGSAQIAASSNAIEVGSSLPTFKFDDATLPQNGCKKNAAPSEEVEEGDLDDVIDAMKTELVQLSEINNLRTAFLESAARSSRQSAEDQKRKNEREVSLITKCQQLLRKSKELKAKSGAMSKKDDSLALPW